MMTDKELAASVVAHLQQTANTSYRAWVKAGKPAGSHWTSAFAALDQIGVTPPAPPTGALDLMAAYGGPTTDLQAALGWLAAHPQPAYVRPGTYTTTGCVDIPPGADLEMRSVAIYPTDLRVGSVRIKGANTNLTWTGVCRIGKVGQTSPRLGPAEAAGVEFEGASNFSFHADDLTIEGTGDAGFFLYRQTHDGTITGKITCVNTAADSFHITDRTYNIDLSGSDLYSTGSGDDGFAVVSYESNGSMVNNIHWGHVTLRNQKWGRGVSVVGGQSVTVDYFDIESSAAAAIYIAAEGASAGYLTYGVNTVTMTGKARNVDVQHIHACNVEFYSAQPAYQLANVNITVDPDTTEAVFRKDGSYPIVNCHVNGAPI